MASIEEMRIATRFEAPTVVLKFKLQKEGLRKQEMDMQFLLQKLMALSYAPRNIKCCLNKRCKGLQKRFKGTPTFTKKNTRKISHDLYIYIG
jgi:hypothetical protein